jgi:hypothetical protein
MDQTAIATQIQREAPCSIELQRAKDGTYYWTAKAYHEPGQEDAAIAALQRVDAQLRALFVEN